MNSQRRVITIATGKKLYIDLALNLARSFFWWHPKSDIQFQLVTDQEELIPENLRNRIEIIPVKPGEFGEGFSPKLSLDILASEGQTLFIDSDCLIFGDLASIFEKFKGHKVSVIGGYISSGEWFGDIQTICKNFNISHIPKFNGGIYYLEKGIQATLVYEKARQIEKKYDQIGFVRLRNRPNDEVVMALAMQLYSQKPIIDDGAILSDPQACPGKFYIDVVAGKRYLTNPPYPHPMHQNWYPFVNVSPVIFHFLGDYALQYPYIRESYRLKKALSKNLNWLAELYGLLRIEYPSRIVKQFKNTFRPVYYKLAGYRKVKISGRT